MAFFGDDAFNIRQCA